MIEPQLKYHVFSDKIMDTVVNFQVLKLKDSFYVWIGSSNKLGNVTVAMPTKFVSKYFSCCGTDIFFLVTSHGLVTKFLFSYYETVAIL